MTNIYGLILSGGESSRMGKDKSLLEFHGKTQRDYLYEILQPFCDQVFLSVKTGKTLEDKFQVINDAFDFRSPLNGILSAFEKHANVAWLTVPVDMPAVNEETFKYILKHRDPSKVVSAFYDSTGKAPEPLLALWEPHAYQLLKAFYLSGKISPRDFIINYPANLFQAPDNQVHLNINTPEDLEKFRKDTGHSS